MNKFLDTKHFPGASQTEAQLLAEKLDAILARDFKGDMLAMLGGYQRILMDNRRRGEWDGIFEILKILFMCGKNSPLNGPMIGVTMALRDSDYFKKTAELLGYERSHVAQIEWMATAWNATFASTGIWMGKTFEPVSLATFSKKCGNNAKMLESFDPTVARIGRNFFREPANPNFIQSLGLPVLTRLWHLKNRPESTAEKSFDSQLLAENLDKEKYIPYKMTGGLFLSLPGNSVVEEMRGKPVYQLNYRWADLQPVYPMTTLVDELVEVADGVYLGQLVMATSHYSLGTVHVPLFGEQSPQWDLGAAFHGEAQDYGYQNNGFFLMIDPAIAKQTYADEAFPILRPRPGEQGYEHWRPTSSLGKGGTTAGGEWVSGWKNDEDVLKKFTRFTLEPSTKSDDGDVTKMLKPGESILQMLQRIQGEISAASCLDDHLCYFEKLNQLFRAGIAPKIVEGVFQGQGRGYNTRFDAPEKLEWYGAEEPCNGFDYYHGATLNLHLGFGDSFAENIEQKLQEQQLLPSVLANLLQKGPRGPNTLNAVWANIGRFIFPWAGKSFEKISGRKLSMLLDESDDLAERYPERVQELKRHPASWPHYDLVKKNQAHYWEEEGLYASHLKSGSWDKGMSEADKDFWRQEAAEHWIFGNNTQDSRILATDGLMRIVDMNYHAPIDSIQQLADDGPSPFVRQGYIFLGTSDRESIMPMNNGPEKKKTVFQFHYRYPLVGGPAPIGVCLDEIVEIAEGLYLGQLIYATNLLKPFHSSEDPAEYQYQLFGYFLLLDNTWEKHRRAIGFDINV